MNRIAIVLLLALTSTAAFSKTMNSRSQTSKSSDSSFKTNDMYAPTLGQLELYLGANVPYGTEDATPIGQKKEVSGYLANGKLAYGLLDWLALYATQGYKSYNYNNTNPVSTSKIVGLTNTAFGIKGIMAFDIPFIYYDAAYSIGLADKYKLSNSTREETAVSDRPELKLQMGGGVPIEMFSGGALVALHLYQQGERTVTTAGLPDVVIKANAGTGFDWKVYGQIDVNWKLGISYEENKVNEYTTSFNGFNSTTTELTQTAITVYGIIPLFQTFEVILSAAKIDYKQAVNTTYNRYDLNSAIRWAF